MGRKSKAKKLNKTDKPKEEKKATTGFFKSLFAKKPKKLKAVPAEQVKTKSTKKLKLPKVKKVLAHEGIDRKKVLLVVFVIIIVAIFSTLGYFIFQRAFRAQVVAKFLPANDTVALLEVNMNFDHSQVIKATNLLAKNPKYSKEILITKLEEFLGVSYANDLKPWFGRAAGATIINSKEEDSVNVVYFVENKSSAEFMALLKRTKSKANNYKQSQVYLFKDKLYMTLIGDYVFASSNEQAIDELIDAQNLDTPKLHNLASYRKIDNNLPLNKAAFFYMNFDEIKDGFFKYFAFLSEAGYSLENLSPFLRLFDSEGLALVAMDDNFSLQSFLALDNVVTENLDYQQMEGKYDAMLADYISKDVAIFWGSQNLQVELDRMLQILSAGEPNTIKIFESILENYSQKYFGNEIGFKKDILPLFEDEFAFTVTQKEDKNIYQLLLKLKSPQKDSLTIYEVANNFTSIGAIFEPKVVEHQLPDGSTGREIVAVPEEIVKAEHPYSENIIYELKMSKQGWGIYYATFDDLAVVANDLDSIKETMDMSNNNANSLKQSPDFAQRMEPIIKTSDEIIYINLKSVTSKIAQEKMPVVLEFVESLSSGRNYFNDGIVTISYIYLK